MTGRITWRLRDSRPGSMAWILSITDGQLTTCMAGLAHQWPTRDDAMLDLWTVDGYDLHGQPLRCCYHAVPGSSPTPECWSDGPTSGWSTDGCPATGEVRR